MIGLKVTAILLDLANFKLWWSFIDMGCYNFVDIFFTFCRNVYILPECLHFVEMFTFCRNVYILPSGSVALGRVCYQHQH